MSRREITANTISTHWVPITGKAARATPPILSAGSESGLSQAPSRPGLTMTNRSGFTLLELLVVLVVISLATALVAPAFNRGLDNFRGQQHMRELASTLRNLRREAIETGRVVALAADYETD
ncbi:MAG TPA: type II secretion system protein GspH, partial [Porticoccaceae bacterium]|nr:type II secretion system protein GspH [Porticoccaceae bacterium]